jgi:two-component system response regulator AdeR
MKKAKRTEDPTTAIVARTVLLIEDDAEAAGAIQTLLRHYQYDVCVAGTVFDGITQANRSPDVILLDLMLPDGAGERVLRHVRRRHLKSKVIVMTGVHEKPRLRDVAKLRPDGVQLKPVNFLDLLAQIRPAPSSNAA